MLSLKGFSSRQQHPAHWLARSWSRALDLAQLEAPSTLSTACMSAEVHTRRDRQPGVLLAQYMPFFLLS